MSDRNSTLPCLPEKLEVSRRCPTRAQLKREARTIGCAWQAIQLAAAAILGALAAGGYLIAAGRLG